VEYLRVLSSTWPMTTWTLLRMAQTPVATPVVELLEAEPLEVHQGLVELAVPLHHHLPHQVETMAFLQVLSLEESNRKWTPDGP
jgi:hypothetical protein